MKILAIETSCDETAAAILEGPNPTEQTSATTASLQLLSNVIVSQVDIFAAYGGVIPEVAARSHLEAILPVIHQALDNAKITPKDLDVIAVTHAPGLLGSLLIGTLTARTLAILWQKPLYAVHHLKSHIYANWLPNDLRSVETTKTPTKTPSFPLLALVISGGHTQIIYMSKHNHFEIIGTTRDDAIGECFDKIAKILGLPYPGGPSIAQCAKKGDPQKYALPHPKVDGLDFSFSGLKTAVLRSVQNACNLSITTPSYELKNHLSETQKADFAASFQATACDILLEKLKIALKEHPDVKSLVFAGGVSANQILREKTYQAFAKSQNAQSTDSIPKPSLYFPTLKYTGDNAAMVAAAAYFEIISGVQATDPYKLNILPRTPIE